MKLLALVSVLFCVGLLGCTPVHLVRLNAPPESERVEVLVHRESAFNAGGIEVAFGADKRDFVLLRNNEYARLYLPPGSYNFFVRSTHSDNPYEIVVSLVAGQRACFKASANSQNYWKPMFSPSYLFTNSFLLEPVSCLSDTEIARYTLVPVEYEKK